MARNNTYRLISNNKKARFNYEILDTYETGLVLLGTEVKSLRVGKVSIQEGYVSSESNELFLTNVNIAEYKYFGVKSHDPLRKRKLLLHKREINKIIDKIKIKGITVVPLKLYFNRKGLAKLEIALAKGKTLYDKRSIIKERYAKKEADMALKSYRKSL